MSVDDIYECIKEIKERLEEKLRHPYVMRHIDLPFVDEDKLLLLYSLLQSANLHIDEIQHYALTIMLVQIALDTHENVSNNTGSEDSHTKRQITALAGDYYSGLYYYLLAERHNIALIRTLAEGIEEVNEEKIVLYQEEKKMVAVVVESVAIIESALLQKACDHFNVPLWKPFVAAAAALKRMEREYVMHQQGKETPVRSLFLRMLPSEELNEAYESCIKNAKTELRKLAEGHEKLIGTMKMLNI
jgi:heptaprenyl diphosphate synthase